MNSSIDSPDLAVMQRRLLLVLDKTLPELMKAHQLPPWAQFLGPILPAALRMARNQLAKTDLIQMQQFRDFMLKMLQSVSDPGLSDEQFLEVMRAAATNDTTKTKADL